jgi:hypothetical protein
MRAGLGAQIATYDQNHNMRSYTVASCQWTELKSYIVGIADD